MQLAGLCTACFIGVLLLDKVGISIAVSAISDSISGLCMQQCHGRLPSFCPDGLCLSVALFPRMEPLSVLD